MKSIFKGFHHHQKCINKYMFFKNLWQAHSMGQDLWKYMDGLDLL